MKKRSVALGCLAVVIVILLVAFLAVRTTRLSSRRSTSFPSRGRSERLAARIEAELAEFRVDFVRDGDGIIFDKQFVFTLELKNEQPVESVVYVVVYGKNDMFVPPRRSAWPLPGLLFTEAGTRSGRLSPARISRNWKSKSESAKGAKVVLKPDGSESFEGALPISETCDHEAWRGQRLDPRSLYNEVYLWVFSASGELIVEKAYDLR